MTFFYDLNKKLAALAVKTEQEQIAESKKAEKIAESPLTKALNESAIAERSTGDYSAKKARAGKDIGKPGKAFAKIAKSAGERYGSKESGERVAGAVLAKLRKEDIADEGNAFGEKVRKAKADGIQKGETIRVGSKIYPVKEADVVGLEEKKAKPDYIDLDKDGNRKETMKKAAKDKKRSAGTAFDPEVAKSMFAHKDEHPRHDVKDTGYSKRYTRKSVDTDIDSDDEVKSDAPKTKGRPKGSKRAIGAKGPTGKSKLLKKDSIKEEEGHVCEMCGQPVVEKAVSKAQQKFMGMVHATQKGEKPASKEVAKVAKEMPKKAAKDFASTKHKGLPAHVEEESKEEVEETTVAGSIAPVQNAAPKASKGMQFGKGVYESMDTAVENMIAEGMSINISVDEQGKKSISVNATEQDAEALADLLKMAGMGGRGQDSSCPTCDQSPCGCAEIVDENSPDYPTNTETSDDALQYSGGLNGPKSTGQTTIPVVASQERRLHSMEESVELENSLLKLYKEFK